MVSPLIELMAIQRDFIFYFLRLQISSEYYGINHLVATDDLYGGFLPL